MKAIKTLLSFVVISFLLTACNASLPSHEETRQAKPVTHIVMVWFKPDVSSDKRMQIKQQTAMLKTIPGLLTLEMGEAIPSQRSIVDDSFDLGIMMQFPSVEAMNAYLVHPQHKAFVNDYVKGNVDKLVVYDF